MENHSKIKDFLTGNLSKEDKENFKSEIAKDERLAEEVAIQHLEEVMKEKIIEEKIRRDVLQLEANYQKKYGNDPYKGRKAATSFPWLWLVLAIILCLGILYGVNRVIVYQDEPIALTSFENNKISSTRNLNDVAEKAARNAIISENAQKIEEGIVYFQAIPMTDIKFSDAQFWLGYAHFLKGEYQQAIGYFEKVKATENSLTKDRLDYFLAVAYLANHQEDKAKAILQTIVTDNQHTYQKEGEKLTKELNSFWRRF